MKIAIIALGTQGDVQPYIALGTGLLKAGHSVRLITHENFEQSVRAHKLEFYAMQGALPVYIGFGSMGSRNPKQTSKLVLEALKQTKCRAIMQAGWGGLSDENLPENVHTVDSVPHSWLFPRVAAVVHHGGAGTTAAGLRAGVPSIVIPFFGD